MANNVEWGWEMLTKHDCSFFKYYFNMGFIFGRGWVKITNVESNL